MEKISLKGESVARDEIINLSTKLGLNVITGSDSHTPIQLGGIYTKLNKDCSTINDLKGCIKRNEYIIEINSSLNFKIFSSKILKDIWLKPLLTIRTLILDYNIKYTYRINYNIKNRL